MSTELIVGESQSSRLYTMGDRLCLYGMVLNRGELDRNKVRLACVIKFRNVDDRVMTAIGL